MKYIGIVVAVAEEFEAVKNNMQNFETKDILGLTFIIGKIGEVDGILVKSGVGKVNAARATQILIDKFPIEYIINLGVAGGLNYKLKLGDIIIGETLVQHDFDITAFGHSKGYIPGIGNIYIRALNQSNPDYNVLLVDMAVFTIVGLLAGIVLDLSYGFIDPRIRMGEKNA